MPPSGQRLLPTVILTAVTLVAFASNSVLCRLALAPRLIDAGTFTFVRLLSGALTLLAVLVIRERRLPSLQIRWQSAVALFAYAMPFSFAYLHIPAGTGALILFGAVQSTMIGSHLLEGHRLRMAEVAGLLLALGGLVVLTFPGIAAPDPVGAALMAVAGVAWGVYSLRGRGNPDALRSTAGNFLMTLPFALPVVLLFPGATGATQEGLALAVASGALASGIGYAIWYTALRGLNATQAGIVQLLVPVLAAFGGVVFLNESVSPRLVLAACVIFGGVVLALSGRRSAR